MVRQHLVLPLHGLHHVHRFRERLLELLFGAFDQNNDVLSLDLWQNYYATTPSVEEPVRHSLRRIVHFHASHVPFFRLTRAACHVHAEEVEAIGALLASPRILGNEWMDAVELPPGFPSDAL